MCNAHNHSAGCTCGFGPPYPGRMALIGEVDWLSELANNQEALERRISALALGEEEAHFRKSYAALFAEGRDPSYRLSWLTGRAAHVHTVIDEESTFTVHVPLFRLHSPRVQGSRVAYQEEEDALVGRAWIVIFLGHGSGKTRTYGVGRKDTCVSEGGQCREVFVPVPVVFQRISLFRDGLPAGEEWRLQAKVGRDGKALRGRGETLLSPAECQERHRREEGDAEPFLLRGSAGTTCGPYERSVSLDVTKTVSLDLKAKGIGIDAKAIVRRVRKLSLEYLLPGGFDYTAWSCPGGVYWDMT